MTLVGAIASSVHFKSGPGNYSLTGKTTLLEMVTRAGGPTKDANLNSVRIRRKNGQSFSIDLYKALTQGDRSQNIVLDDGDLVLIPLISTEANRVYVFGEVEKPGVYAFTGTGIHLLPYYTANCVSADGEFVCCTRSVDHSDGSCSRRSKRSRSVPPKPSGS